MPSHSAGAWGRRGVQPVAFGDTPSVDAFSRARVSDPVTLLDVMFEYDAQPLIMDTKTVSTSATVTHSSVSGSVALTAGGTSSGQAILQSFDYTRYQPGKSLTAVQTFVMGAASSVATRRVGRFDANDGVFFEQTGSGLNLVLRRNTTGGVTETRVAQASWNLDPLNGAGASKLTLVPTKPNIFWCDSQFLGVGRIRAGFDIGGAVVYAHEFTYANETTRATMYARHWNLPLRWSSTKNSTGTDAGLSAFCGTVISEGGFETDRGITVAAGNTANVACTTAAIRPVLSIRPALTFKGRTNRMKIEVDAVDVFAAANPAQWYLYYEADTLTPSSWANVSTAHSGLQVNRHATTGTVSGGVTVKQGFIAAAGSPAAIRGAVNQTVNSKLPLTLDIDSTDPKTLTLAAIGVGGTANVRAAMSWRELR